MADWQYTPLLVVFLLGVVPSLGVALRSVTWLRREQKRVIVALVGLLAFNNAVWNVAATVKTASQGLDAKLFWYKLQFLGSGANPSVALALALALLGADRYLSRRRLAALAVPVAVFVPLIVVNPWNVMITDPHLVAVGELVALEHEFPLAFTVFLAWSLGATAAAIGLLAYRWLGHRERGPSAILVAVALLVPVVTIALKVGNVYPPGGDGFAITPAANSVALTLIALAVFRYELLELRPVGRDHAIEQLRDGYLLTDGSGQILDANEAACDLLDADNGALVGRNVADAVPGHESLDGTSSQATFERDGLVVEVTASRVEQFGEPVGRALVLRDISEQHERERELAAARDAFQTIVEASPVPIWVQGVDTIRYANDAAAEFFGRPDADAVVGDSALGYVPSDQRDRTRRLNEGMIEDGETMDGLEGAVVAADGTRREAVFAAAPIQYRGEQAIVTIARDVTDQRAYERTLETQMSELKMLIRLLRHDINNDMNVVLGMAEMAREDSEDEAVREALDHVLSASNRVVDLTQTARNLMKAMVAEGRERHPVLLSRVLKAEIASARESFDDATVRVAGELPGVYVEGDDLLSSVFRNLLENAVVHNDSASPEVVVAATADEETVRVAVADDGPGVSDDQKETVFGKGEQGLASEGTGIGLYLVQSLVSNYGGTVRVADRSDHDLFGLEPDPEATGAVFVVELAVTAEPTD